MTDGETTVSWMAIEKGWKVVCADGEEIGVVFNTVGDRNADIFDGLAITHHAHFWVAHNYLDRPRYVAAEQVHDIQPGVVHLTVTTEESTQLPEHEAPESAEIEPGKASLTDRLRTDVEHWTGEDKTY